MRRARRALIGVVLGIVSVDAVSGCSGEEFTATDSPDASNGGSAGRGGNGGASGVDAGGKSGAFGSGASAGKSGSGGSGNRGGSGGVGGTAGASGTAGAGGTAGGAGKGGLGGSGGSGGCTSDAECSALNGVCSVGRCDSAHQCTAAPAREGQSCDDALFCTTGDACRSGTCTGSPLVCGASSNPCLPNGCDEANDRCAPTPAADGTPCNDGVACTSGDNCRAGSCAGAPITACINGDGCCPSSCQGSTDSDCPTCVNRALTAIASSSGGGTNNFGPDKMNDGIGEMPCSTNHWINNSSTSSGWIELDWPSPVTIASIYIETPNVDGSPCTTVAGRNIQSAVIEWWNGANWVTLKSLSGLTNDIKTDFPGVTTNKLRLSSVLSGPGTNGNSIIYEWHVYSQPGCTPPP